MDIFIYLFILNVISIQREIWNKIAREYIVWLPIQREIWNKECDMRYAAKDNLFIV